MCAIFQKRAKKAKKGISGLNIWKFGQKRKIFWKRVGDGLRLSPTKKTARIGPDNHSAVNRDVDLFIICTLSISKLPDYTQLEFFKFFVKK